MNGRHVNLITYDFDCQVIRKTFIRRIDVVQVAADMTEGASKPTRTFINKLAELSKLDDSRRLSA